MARAQSAGDKADALFQRGKQLMAENQIAEACAAFDESQQLEASPATVMNQAYCRERLGQLATARALYVEAARQTSAMRERKWKQTHATATDRAAKLDPRLSTLRIDVPDDHVVEGLEVLRDGAVVPRVSWNEALPIDGGTYRISARASERLAWSEIVTVAVEGDARVVEVPRLAEAPRLPRPSVAASAAPPRPGGEPPRPEPAEPTKPGAHTRWTGKRKVAVGLAAATVAALGAGTVLGVASNHKRDQTDALCPDPRVACDAAARANQLSASASHFAIGADVAFGFAAGAAAATVFLWVTGAPGPEHLAIAPAASPGRLLVTASRSW